MQSQPYIRAVRIEGFRSCERTTLNPHARLSVLIGPNGAGKTNVLQALTMLAGHEPRHFAKAESAALQCRILAEFQVGRSTVALRSTLRYSLDEDNRENVVESRDEWRFGSISGARGAAEWMHIPADYMYFSALERAPSRVIRYPDGRIRFVGARHEYRRLRTLHRGVSGPAHKKLAEYVARVNAFRAGISYYSASQFTNPANCPSSFEIDEERDLVVPIQRQTPHQRFLLDLYRLRETNEAKYKSYIALVGRQGLKLLTSIGWKEVKVASSQVEVRTGGKIVRRYRQRLLVVPSVKTGFDRLSFSQLSEGTFKTLALIFYLITDRNRLLLIEEPEVCVHHGLLASIVELMKGESSSKQIIFSTHSDFVLDQVEPENVIAVSRTTNRGTVARAIATASPQRNIEALREFLKHSGNLGEFWRNGGFDT